jgi:hypothetical protein
MTTFTIRPNNCAIGKTTSTTPIAIMAHNNIGWNTMILADEE